MKTVTVVGGSKTIINGTKTPKSRRVVLISSVSRDALKTWKDTTAFKRRKAGEVWQEHGPVFPTAVGTPHSPRNLARRYDELVKHAGVPRIRIHDIRHTSAALAMECGVPLLAVSKRLGHARPSVNHWRHVRARHRRHGRRRGGGHRDCLIWVGTGSRDPL